MAASSQLFGQVLAHDVDADFLRRAKENFKVLDAAAQALIHAEVGALEISEEHFKESN